MTDSDEVENRFSKAFDEALKEARTRPEVKKMIRKVGFRAWYRDAFMVRFGVAGKMIFDRIDEILNYRHKRDGN
jgi:hypothetical protein